MVYPVPPGLTVIVGQSPPDPSPQSRYWLTVTVTVAVGLPGVSVPDAGNTPTAPSGSLATVTDQLTGPPDADSVIWAAPPGSTVSVPPPGDADSVPVGVGVGVGDGRGVGGGAGVGGALCVGGALFLTFGGALRLAGGGVLG